MSTPCPACRPSLRWKTQAPIAFALLFAIVPLAAAEEAAIPSHDQARAQIQRMLVASPYKISPAARAGTIRYTFDFADGRVWPWPTTAEQSVRIEGDTIVVTVCADCGDEAVDANAIPTRYREPNPWVDSSSREVAALARSIGPGGSVERRMKRLVEAVQKHMNGAIDFRRYDPASVALRSRSGDCTEFAVILAAAARHLGIPARVVSGIAYSSRFTGQSHVFSPHVWTQAWDGERWTSYDAGLGAFDAGHVALHVGDGSTEGLVEVSRAIMALRLVDVVGVRHVDTPKVNGAARDP